MFVREIIFWFNPNSDKLLRTISAVLLVPSTLGNNKAIFSIQKNTVLRPQLQVIHLLVPAAPRDLTLLQTFLLLTQYMESEHI